MDVVWWATATSACLPLHVWPIQDCHKQPNPSKPLFVSWFWTGKTTINSHFDTFTKFALSLHVLDNSYVLCKKSKQLGYSKKHRQRANNSPGPARSDKDKWPRQRSADRSVSMSCGGSSQMTRDTICKMPRSNIGTCASACRAKLARPRAACALYEGAPWAAINLINSVKPLRWDRR